MTDGSGGSATIPAGTANQPAEASGYRMTNYTA